MRHFILPTTGVILMLASLACNKKDDGTTGISGITKPTLNYVTRPQTSIAWPTLAPSAWPIARHDAQGTGRGAYTGPSQGKVKCTIPAGVEISDASFGSDSVFYFVSGKVLRAATTSGRVIWTFTMDSGISSENPPLIGADGTIYVGSTTGTYYAIRPDSTVKWQLPLGAGAIFMKSAGIDLNGTIYVGAGTTLSAISNSGNVLWQKQAPKGVFSFGATSAISFSPDGATMYIPVTSASVNLLALDLNGNLRWADSLGGSQFSSPAVDNDGNIFLFAGNDLVSLSSSGHVRWRIANTGPNWDVTIDINGNVSYLADGYLVSVDNIGQERWRVMLDAGDYITHLVSDAAGTVYAETGVTGGGGTYNIYAISSTGSVRWKLPVQAYVKVGGVSLSKDGYLIFSQAGNVGAAPNQLYVIE
jgi:outer membrane protein assembly factor BamB